MPNLTYKAILAQLPTKIEELRATVAELPQDYNGEPALVYNDNFTVTALGVQTITKLDATSFFNVTVNGEELVSGKDFSDNGQGRLTINPRTPLQVGEEVQYYWVVGSLAGAGSMILADSQGLVPESKLPPISASTLANFIKSYLDTWYVPLSGSSNIAPVANAGADNTITLPNNVTLVGSATDSDGTVATYAWSKLSGPGSFTITTPNAATTTVTGLAVGTYVFRLTATDDDGATSIDDVQVTVLTAPVGGVVNVLRLDSGATTNTTYNGVAFVPDDAYLTTPGTSSNYTDGSPVANTSFSNFYQSVRYANNTLFEYTVTGLSTNADYDVLLHFQGFTAGHIFNVKLAGTQIATNLDVAAEAGGTGRALIKRYPFSTASGQIVISFQPVSGAIGLAGMEFVARNAVSGLV
jgi:hypothetical protein